MEWAVEGKELTHGPIFESAEDAAGWPRIVKIIDYSKSRILHYNIDFANCGLMTAETRSCQRKTREPTMQCYQL